MIKPGIKLGPKGWQQRLKQSGARYCEVWFRIDKPEWYADMFAYLKKCHINTGLHFWAVINGSWEPNIAYPGETLTQTLNLIKKTVDIASQHGFHYVNVHCGNRALVKLNLEKQLFLPDTSKPILDHKQAETVLETSASRLNHYAQSKKILFLVETVGAKTANGSAKDQQARLTAIDYFTVPISSLAKLAQRHKLSIANDFCHTFSDAYDKPLNLLWQTLWDKTVTLAPYTKLLHINTVTPPFNGTDSHGGITAADFRTRGTFPTHSKLKQLLTLFKHHHDVWAVNEPQTNHVANYQALVQLLTEI